MAKPNPLRWETGDASELRQFLSKCPKFLQVLKKRLPRNKTPKTQEEAANAGQQMEGYLQALDHIEAMRDDVLPPPPEGMSGITDPKPEL